MIGTVRSWMWAALVVTGCSSHPGASGDGGTPDHDAPAGADARPDARPDGGGVHDAAFDAATPRDGDSHDGGTHDAGPDAAPPDAAPPKAVTVLDPDSAGSGATLFSAGSADPSGPFFTALGTNQRSCATCHDRANGWSVTPASIQARFDATDGNDPIFRLVDGATRPDADVSTASARSAAYVMLRTKGLIRIQLAIPAGAEFTLDAVDDPYGYASAAHGLSLFRRPLPATNLPFEATVMWDGREPSLAHQATDATLGHGQAGSADAAQMAAIVTFETALYTAQAIDAVAGDLAGSGATGGTAALAAQAFHLGINDPFGGDPQHGTFDANVFTEFAAWAGLTGVDAATQRRLSIARGEVLFNTKTFAISGVPGIPDQASATCSTCHDTPGTGGHSLDVAMSLGLDSETERTSDLPLYTLKRISDGATVKTSDPGRAMTTGKWADIGLFKVPALRGLVMRPPYFHHGVEPSLSGLVDFYKRKFSISLSGKDEADLAAFLAAL